MARGSALQLAGLLPGLLGSAADAIRARPGQRVASYLAGSWLGDAGALTPIPPLSLSLAAKVAADEAFRALMVGMSRVPSAGALRDVRAELGAAASFFSERGWLDDPTGYHPAPPGLGSPRVSRANAWGTQFDHLQFVSGYEPRMGEPGRERWMSYKPCRTAHASVLRHRGASRPWLVCVHGYRMGFPLADFRAFRVDWLHRELGFNVVIPTLPLHGERTVGSKSGDGFFTSQLMDTIHAEAQAVWDLRRVLEWVKGQNPVGVGIYGISLGAYTAALLAAFEADVDCVIAGMPAVCLAQLLAEHAPRRLWSLAEHVGLRVDDVTTVLRVVSPLSFAPAVSRDRLHLYGALADRLVPTEHVQRLWEHWQRPSIQWFEGSHLSSTWESVINDLVHRALCAGGLIDDERRVAPVLTEAA